jgi:hypothetical protein
LTTKIHSVLQQEKIMLEGKVEYIINDIAWGYIDNDDGNRYMTFDLPVSYHLLTGDFNIHVNDKIIYNINDNDEIIFSIAHINECLVIVGEPTDNGIEISYAEIFRKLTS